MLGSERRDGRRDLTLRFCLNQEAAFVERGGDGFPARQTRYVDRFEQLRAALQKFE